jgi:hypothetical protein
MENRHAAVAYRRAAQRSINVLWPPPRLPERAVHLCNECGGGLRFIVGGKWVCQKCDACRSAGPGAFELAERLRRGWGVR